MHSNKKYAYATKYGLLYMFTLWFVRFMNENFESRYLAFTSGCMRPVASRSVQTMQLCSLGQGTVCPWSIVPRCPRVLQVLPTMSDSWDCESWDTSELPDIIKSTCNTLGQRGTMLHGDTVPRSKVASCGQPSVCGSQQGQVVMTSFTSISAVLLL